MLSTPLADNFIMCPRTLSFTSISDETMNRFGRKSNIQRLAWAASVFLGFSIAMEFALKVPAYPPNEFVIAVHKCRFAAIWLTKAEHDLLHLGRLPHESTRNIADKPILNVAASDRVVEQALLHILHVCPFFVSLAGCIIVFNPCAKENVWVETTRFFIIKSQAVVISILDFFINS